MAKINTVFNLTDNVSNRLRTINNTVNSSVMGFESMAGKLITVNSALDLVAKGLDLVKKTSSFFSMFISDASEYESLLTRLAVSIGDFSEAEKEFEKLKDFAADSPFDLPGVVRASIMFRNVGVEAENLIPTIKMLGDVAQGSGEYFNRIAMNYMQIKSAGKATMQDLNQFAYMEVPIKQVLKDMGVTGVATAEDIEKAFKIMTSAGGQFYNSMSSNSGTMSGQLSNTRDAIQQLSASIGNTLLPVVTQLTSAFGNFITSVSELETFNSILEKMKTNAINFRDEISSLIATLIYLGTVATVVGTVMATFWAIANWPITLTIALIGSLLSAFYEIINGANEASIAMNGFANQCANAGKMFGKVIGFIVGLVKGLVNIIYNVFAVLYNSLETFIEFFANIFTHPIKAIQSLFINTATTILDVLATITSAVDWIFGTSWSESLNNASKKLQEFKKQNIATDGYITGTAGIAGLLELRNNESLWKISSDFGNFGEDIGMAIDRNFTFTTPEIPEMPPSGDLKFDSSGALIVSDKNTVSLADDFRNLLSEQATQKFNLQFSTVTPSVNVGDIVVNNNMDYDKVFDAIVNGVEEAQSSNLRS